jgi:anti-anti-sigma factor
LPPGYLHIVRTTEGQTTVLLLQGELDMGSSAALEEELARLGNPDAVLVDLQALTFMDARGLHALLDAQRAAERRGRSFAIINAGAQVRSLLKLGDVQDSELLLDRSRSPQPASMIAMRDRLLLAFANLTSYGIVAHPHLPGSVETAHQQVAVEVRTKYPYGANSYVFWRAHDDARFRADGTLPPSVELPLHYGSDDVIPAVIAACIDVSIEISPDRRNDILLARDAAAAAISRD